MTTLEIVGGIVILVLCLAIVILCLMQENKGQDSMTSALTGASSESFYGQNEGRTKEAKLAKTTRFLGILLFLAVLAVNFIPMLTEK